MEFFLIEKIKERERERERERDSTGGRKDAYVYDIMELVLYIFSK
jgi:hypothetical protein